MCCLSFVNGGGQDIAMSDDGNAENHTVRLLQEMRAEAGEFRREMTEFRQVTERRLDSLEQRVGLLEPSVLKVNDAVTAIAKTQGQHTALLMAHSEKLTETQRSQSVMEKDMRGLRGRVERVEDRTGLV